MKARTSIKSNFVTFVVAYAPTEGAAEGQKAKYRAALESTIVPVLAREYFFVLTAANARTGKRGEGGGEGKQTARYWAHKAEICSTKQQATSRFHRR